MALAAPAVSFVGMIRFRFEGSSGRIAPQSQPSAEGTPTGKAQQRERSPFGKQKFRTDVVDARNTTGPTASKRLSRNT
jgi:hypothetical protein